MALTGTFNRILNLAENFGTRHAQIRRFQIGRVPEDLDTDKKVNGIYMLFEVVRMSLSRGTFTYTIQGAFYDQNNRGADEIGHRQPTVNDIYNDTMLVALDFISYFRGVGSGSSANNCLGIYENLDIDDASVNIEPFEHIGRHGYAGMVASFNLKVPFDYSRSQIPLDVAGGGVVPADTITITVNDSLSELIQIFGSLAPTTQILTLSDAFLVGVDGIQCVNEGDGQVAIIQTI